MKCCGTVSEMEKVAPTLIADVVDADCAELRDIAEWFDRQGKKPNGDFLRAVANRHEVLFGAYWTKVQKGTARELTLEECADCGLLSEFDD